MQSISTLMDGELDEHEAGREIIRLNSDSSCRESWDDYHLIGDVMRGGATGASARAAGLPKFCARFSERLALEPTVLAPQKRFTRKVQTYAMAAAASVAAIAVVGWVALNSFNPDAPGVQLAKAPLIQPQVLALQAPATLPQPLSAAQPRSAKGAYAPSDHIHEYLLAHQGISPTTAIQGVTPYIRTVSSTGD